MFPKIVRFGLVEKKRQVANEIGSQEFGNLSHLKFCQLITYNSLSRLNDIFVVSMSLFKHVITEYQFGTREIERRRETKKNVLRRAMEHVSIPRWEKSIRLILV